MVEIKMFDKVTFVTDSRLVGIITGIVERPGGFTYLVKINNEMETEHYKNELKLYGN